MSTSKIIAVILVVLGIAAIALPYLFGTLAVSLLGGIMLTSGIVSLFFVLDARRQGLPVSLIGPWAQIIAGIVILFWPELALWVAAVLLGGGLILSGIAGLSAMRDAGPINPPLLRKVGLWANILLGVILIALGSLGSAVLLGLILGLALITAGVQRWREADLFRY